MPDPITGIAAIGTAGSLYQGHKAGKTADRMADSQTAIAAQQMAMAQDQWDYYKSQYRPLESQLVSDAGLSGAEIQSQVNQTASDVGQNFDQAAAIQQRELTRMGINPNSGRYQGLANSNALQRAQAKAHAMNLARTQGRAEDWNQRVTALGLGKGLPSQVQSGLNNASGNFSALAKQYGDAAANSTQLAMRFAGAGLGADGNLKTFGKNLIGA